VEQIGENQKAKLGRGISREKEKILLVVPVSTFAFCVAL